MLLLTRKPGESVIIGEDNDIVITVLRIRGQQAQIGIQTTSRTVPVHRKEVYERIKAIDMVTESQRRKK